MPLTREHSCQVISPGTWDSTTPAPLSDAVMMTRYDSQRYLDPNNLDNFIASKNLVGYQEHVLQMINIWGK